VFSVQFSVFSERSALFRETEIENKVTEFEQTV
jgi:hypothetical protein